jgi:hypothetical protein
MNLLLLLTAGFPKGIIIIGIVVVIVLFLVLRNNGNTKSKPTTSKKKPTTPRKKRTTIADARAQGMKEGIDKGISIERDKPKGENKS